MTKTCFKLHNLLCPPKDCQQHYNQHICQGMQTFDCNVRQKEWNCVPGMYLRQPLILLALVVLFCHINLQTCRKVLQRVLPSNSAQSVWFYESNISNPYKPYSTTPTRKTKISSSDGGSQMCKSLWTMAQYKLHQVWNRSHPQIQGNHEIVGE